MVLWHATWYIDKDKVKEYTKLASDELIPFWMKQKGMKEFRAYRFAGTTKVLILIEFDSTENWGKAMDNYNKSGLPEKFVMYTNHLEYTLYQNSPVIPEPLKPK
jgi:hypothetical protein